MIKLFLLKLISAKTLLKYLPDVLAYILTKVLTYVFSKYPAKSQKAIETVKEITLATANAIKASSDGKITKAELRKQKELWKKVFK